jgi:cytochrome d ubiquinol oxidase subunit I
MDVEILARLQFALTIMFHYIYPTLSIGLGLVMVIIEGLYIITRRPIYQVTAQFWTKIFALTFAMGVATGIVMEFEFGTNWSAYSRYVGDVFGSALAAEGVFAFFLESGFLALLLFGWDRISAGWHFFATVMVALGAHFSAIWIVVANSWMQTPAGYHIVGEGMRARAEILDFWGMVFNPSSMTRLMHTLIGCWLAGAFLVISVAAFYMYHRRSREFASISMRIGLFIATVSVVLQAVSGDKSGKIVAVHQPAKLAALEGLFHTEKGAGLSIFGIPNQAEGRLDYAITIPKLLSWLSFGDANAEVQGLDKVPKQDWPRIAITYNAYRLMLAMWAAMLVTCLVCLYLGYHNRLAKTPWALRLCMISVIFPQIANEAGWVSAEVGRYPWIVQGHLRISEGLSKAVSAEQVLGSILMFGMLYSALFALFLYIMREKIRHGPEDLENTSVYHHLEEYVEKATHGTVL